MPASTLSQPRFSSFTATALTTRIGARITGIDITQPLSATQVSELRHALVHFQVVQFREQAFSLETQKRFGSYFGALHIHPGAPGPAGHPEVLRIHADAHSTYVAGEGWHSDVSCDAEPPLGSILHLHTVPPTGGDTLFSSAYAAYDSLSSRMQRYLEGLRAVHSGEHVYRGRYRNLGVEDSNKQYPVHSHPVIRTVAETGRKALFVNPGFTTHIEGLPRDESAAILEFLYTHIQKPDFQVRLNWEANSVIFWDNRSTQHLAIWDYFPHVRSGNRITIQGERPQ